MNVISLDELMRLTMTTESKFVRYSDHLAAIEQARKEEREAWSKWADAVVVENGRVLLRSGALWLDALLGELTMFPESEHDDQVDALVCGIVMDVGLQVCEYMHCDRKPANLQTNIHHNPTNHSTPPCINPKLPS